MSKALYRTYRSKNLSEVVGQRHITDILSRAIAEGKLAHAYLFTGPRGVGKTSIARILAHEINGLAYNEEEPHLDIIEIDAASNNGVEDIRDLRERVQLTPVSAKKKVYIIDEVHMLSKAAFNALLKTLEEPPEHVVFILATTDADKLPDTIISRTQRFIFRTISTAEVAGHLGWIAKQEGFTVEPEALELIARHGEGSFRDSIGLLDQLRSAADKKTGITKSLVENFLGLPPQELVQELIAAHESHSLEKIISLLDKANASGAQATIIAGELIRACTAELAAKPQLLPLLDELLEVARSSRPDVKLLVALADENNNKSVSAESPKPKNVSLATAPTRLAVSSEKQDKKAEPREAKPKPKETPTATKEPVQPATFDWEKVLRHIQANDIALYSVLAKCTVFVEGDTLNMYTTNVFYKKKLDSARYRTNFVTFLESLGMDGLIIATFGTSAPPKDELVAAAARIMGGGEEYIIEEDEGKK